MLLIEHISDFPPMLIAKAAPIAGVVSILFGVGAAIALFVKMLNLGPGLCLDNRGFAFTLFGGNQNSVAWNEVKGYRIIEIYNQKLISVFLKNPDAYLARITPVARALAKTNMSSNFGGGPITISAVDLDIDFNSLVALFERYCQRYVTN